MRARLERLLLENIVPFWHPQAVDRWRGGYRINHDVDGTWLGAHTRTTVGQARMLWFFSRLHRSPYGTAEHLEAAEHGYRFLRRRLWDARHGGVWWSVRPWGLRVVDGRKHLYGQAFALYALAEYARASGEGGARELAQRLVDLLELRAHDPVHGGYVEAWARDWTPLPDGERTPLAVPAGRKSMNTHLHLLEAVTNHHVAGGHVGQRLAELAEIIGDVVVRARGGSCVDEHERDWTPVEDGRVSYGHDLETVWLLVEADLALGRSPLDRLDRHRSIVDHALAHGFDHARGGFHLAGPVGAAADDTAKVWWVQAEGLVAALHLWQLTGEDAYAVAFERTLAWIEEHQADWRHGEWHARIVDGRPRGPRASRWKTAYHGGRAVLECLERLADPL